MEETPLGGWVHVRRLCLTRNNNPVLIPFSKLAGSAETYALCVVGAGPAGIIVALEYARSCADRRILLVDFGAPGAPSRNALDEHIVVRSEFNHHSPDQCTNKGLGGSTATWGGRCVMYDRADFYPRQVVDGGCTWDTSFYEECLPFVDAAQRYFESGNGPFDLANDKGKSQPVPPLADGFHSDRVTDTVLERWSLPTRFGPHYSKAIIEQPNLDLLLGVEARVLAVPDSSGRLDHLGLRDVQTGVEVKARADIILLATGCQEVTRLLLRNPWIFGRLAKVPESLGRFYQGHTSGKIASVRFRGNPAATEYGFRREPDGTYQRRRFQFSERTLIDFNLLNTAFWLDNPLYFDPAHRNGAMSFMYLAMITPLIGRKLAPPAVAYSITKGKVNRVGKHLWNIFKDLPGSLLTPASIFVRRYLFRRKLPGVFLYNADNCYALHFHAEQIPTEGNRMELAPDGETLIIHYRVTEADAAQVVRAHEVLDSELRSSGCGELIYWFPQEERERAIQIMSKDGIHQSGTTRIADDPSHGVVDRDLRVWGTSNLYVCSSSVFPTSGQANPTFFMGVCAIRLARYLSRHAHG